MEFHTEQRLQIIKIVCLCSIWYFSSSTGNVISKILLTEFPYPVTLTMVQHLCLLLNLPPLIRCWGVKKLQEPIGLKYYLTIIVPLAAGKFLANVSASFSIWKVPLSYAHTVKATMPLWTVVLSRLFLGERHKLPVYISLLPIIVGVLIATVTEISFEMSGLLAALAATMGFSLQNIFTKKTMKDTGIHHLQLLLLLVKISASCFLPIWLLTDVRHVLSNEELSRDSDKIMKSAGLLLLDAYLSFVQSMCAFHLISLITPLSYAVANATKRITIITFSILMMKNPVTVTNVFGMTLAISGVFLYNRAKYIESLDQTSSSTTTDSLLPVLHKSRSGVFNVAERNYDRGDYNNHIHQPNGGVIGDGSSLPHHHKSSHHRVNVLGTPKNGFIYEV